MSSFSKTSCSSKTDDVMFVYRLLYIPFTIYSFLPMWELPLMPHLGSSSYVQHSVCLLCRIWDLLLKSRLISSVKFHLDLPSVPIWDLPFISHLGSFPCVRNGRVYLCSRLPRNFFNFYIFFIFLFLRPVNHYGYIRASRMNRKTELITKLKDLGHFVLIFLVTS